MARPRWSNGKRVKVGQHAVSFRGPMEIISIEYGDDFWRLYGYIPAPYPCKKLVKYVIDEGNDKQHPVKEGEWCEFWGCDFDED